MDIAKLTKKLVAIPSYVDKRTNEVKLGNFIINFLKSNTAFKTTRQKVGKRFNIFTYTGKVKLLLIGHMDTVPPKNSAQLKPAIKNGKIYGLGTADMKGGLACILSVVAKAKDLNGIGCLFYVGEEYDFAGMKVALKEFKIKPDLVLSADGTDTKLGISCRGLLEVDFKAYGKSAPAYREKVGANPIIKLVKIINLAKARFPGTVINLSYLRGGLLIKNKIINQPNCVPNYARGTFDIRPYRIKGQDILDFITQKLTKDSVKIFFKKKLYLPGWKTSQFQVETFTKIIQKFKKITYQKPQNRGFIDIALIANTFGVPCADFGPGSTKKAHSENEYVNIKNLLTCEAIFRATVDYFASRQK